MEGLALVFIGMLVVLITALEGIENHASALVYRVSGVMLIVMAGMSAFTGARTSIIPMKLCPPIFLTVSAMYLLGSM